MNIKSTLTPQKPTKPRLLQNEKPQTDSFRPPVDWWESGGKRYEDTTALLNALTKGEAQPGEATYRWSTRANSPGDLPKMTAVGALDGAGLALGASVAGVVALNAAMAIASSVTGGLRAPDYIGLGADTLSLVAGAGAVLGGAKEYFLQKSLTEEKLAARTPGTIAMVDGKPSFFANNENSNPVDLASYAQAKPLPQNLDKLSARKVHSKEMAIASAASAIPLAGSLYTMASFGLAGEACAHSPGFRVGLAAGAQISTLPLIGAKLYGLPGYIGGTAAAAAVGGLSGFILGPTLESACSSPETKSQWWRQSMS